MTGQAPKQVTSRPLSEANGPGFVARRLRPRSFGPSPAHLGLRCVRRRPGGLGSWSRTTRARRRGHGRPHVVRPLLRRVRPARRSGKVTNGGSRSKIAGAGWTSAVDGSRFEAADSGCTSQALSSSAAPEERASCRRDDEAYSKWRPVVSGEDATPVTASAQPSSARTWLRYENGSAPSLSTLWR